MIQFYSNLIAILCSEKYNFESIIRQISILSDLSDHIYDQELKLYIWNTIIWRSWSPPFLLPFNYYLCLSLFSLIMPSFFIFFIFFRPLPQLFFHHFHHFFKMLVSLFKQTFSTSSIFLVVINSFITPNEFCQLLIWN